MGDKGCRTTATVTKTEKSSKEIGTGEREGEKEYKGREMLQML